MSEVTVLSASQCSTYAGCSLRWHLRYRERAPEESRSGPLVVGSVIDTVLKAGLHQLRNGEVRLEELDPEQLFEAAWEAELASTTDAPIVWNSKGVDAARRTALALVTQYLSREDVLDLANRLDLDVRFELPLVDEDLAIDESEVQLVGILDATDRFPDGRRHPLDWKTAASRSGYDEETLKLRTLQGPLYVWATGRMLGEDAATRMRYHVGIKTAKPTWQEIDVDMPGPVQQRALRTVVAIHHAMKAGNVYPQPSFLCGSCPHREACKAWTGGRTKKVVDVFAQAIARTCT